MKTPVVDLLGEPIVESVSVSDGPRLRKIGYAARPGTGPKRQRCATCVHSQRVLHRGSYSTKCERMAHAWTHGPETDIKPNAPACREWERKPFAPKPAVLT